MSLFEQINEDIKQAMLAKEKDKLEALKAVKAAFLLAKTEKGQTHELSQEKEISIIQKLVKQRKESAEIYNQNNRKELADIELFQSSVIEKYLPQQLSDEELTFAIKSIISETGATTIKDMGKVIGLASKELAGKADGKTISEKIRSLLNPS